MSDRLFAAGVFMNPVTSRSTAVAFTLTLSLAAMACGGSAESAAPATPVDASIVRLAPENVTTAAMGQITSGPVISGQLTPAREASIRAQVGGSIVALTVDRGQNVRAGAVVARISSRDLEAARSSAQVSVRSSETALKLAQSEAERTQALVAGGALAARDLEQAQNNVSAAEAQVAAARARLSSVDQAIDDTSVKAPFDGVVSARPASIGDIVTPGSELFTIIDPSSMRLEASVPSDQVPQLRPGATVRFTIRGIPGDFTGRIDRINPTVDPVTRQVSCFVTLPNTGGRLLAGLFAEGRVESVSKQGIVVPLGAVDETGLRPVVTRVAGDKAEVVPVTLGARQVETEMVEITEGLRAGDLLIVGSAKNVPSGTPILIVQ
jgi:membrane fusion protein (multidrug efflux system)